MLSLLFSACNIYWINSNIYRSTYYFFAKSTISNPSLACVCIYIFKWYFFSIFIQASYDFFTDKSSISDISNRRRNVYAFK